MTMITPKGQRLTILKHEPTVTGLPYRRKAPWELPEEGEWERVQRMRDENSYPVYGGNSRAGKRHRELFS